MVPLKRSMGVTIMWGLGAQGSGCTWTQKVCRTTALFGVWAIILPAFGGPGLGFQYFVG